MLYGTPNVCTNCHKDKEDKWAADAVKDWYLIRKNIFYFLFYLQGAPDGKENLLLIADNTYPAISRASAIQQ